jgi:hypothetical protein
VVIVVETQDTVWIVVQKLDWSSGHGMLVMFEVTHPVERTHTMTRRQGKIETADIKAVLSADGDFCAMR